MHIVRKPTDILIQFNLQESKPMRTFKYLLERNISFSYSKYLYRIYISFIEIYKNLNASSEHSADHAPIISTYHPWLNSYENCHFRFVTTLISI